jgi:hypothetical protein
VALGSSRNLEATGEVVDRPRFADMHDIDSVVDMSSSGHVEACLDGTSDEESVS